MGTKECMMNLRFLVQFKKTLLQALEMLQQVYGDNTILHTYVFEWHQRFKEGWKEVNDDSRSRRPSTNRTENDIDWVRQVVRGKRQLTIWMIAKQLDMKNDSIWKVIIKVLGMSEK